MSYTSAVLSRSSQAGIAGRLRDWLRRHPVLTLALATFGLAASVLIVTYRPTPLVVPERVAVRASLADKPTAQILRQLHWTRVEATPMDHRYEILGFYRGDRIVAAVTVGYHRRPVVLDAQNLTRQPFMYGANVANDPRVLAVLAVVFVLMTAVWPLWRLRNLDVLAIVSLTLTVVLFNRGLLAAMSLLDYPLLAYVAARCAWWGLRGPHRTEGAETVPLFEQLTRAWTAKERKRVLGLMLAAAALVTAMVGLTSPSVLDVGYAVMEGATGVIHGILPYGHIPDVLHGDTYPLASYLLYTPLAWLSPVHNVWENADAALLVAVLASLFVAVGMFRMARPRGGRGRHGRAATPPADRARTMDTSGLRSAVAWLTFPPLLVTVSTGTSDVALAALLVGVLMLWRRPAWSTGLLTVAAWFKLVPLAIAPLIIARLRGRALGRAGLAAVLVSTGMLAVLFALGGLDAPAQMLKAMSFQFSRGSEHTLWAVIGSRPLQQLIEAATVALIVAGVSLVRTDPSLHRDRARIAAIAGATLLGLQIAANYWNYMYLVWAFPFVALSLLRDPWAIGPAAAE